MNQTMPLQRGGKRPGAGRKPRARTALEAIKGSDAGQESGSPAIQDPEPKGWAVILYVEEYIRSKDPRALGALAKQHPGGPELVDALVTFFQGAQRYIRGDGA